tara:strand:+ start:3306 stop:3548 length:243 start_codon:yes stop_codon:yes gene_type:complete
MQEVMEAHWLENDDTGLMCIIGAADADFEYIGEIPDDDEAVLLAMSDEVLGDDDSMTSLGYTVIQQSLRRFSEEDGYYHA